MSIEFKTFIAATAFVTLLAACTPTSQQAGGPPPPRASTEVAGSVCETHALAEEHHTLTSRIGAIEDGAPTNYQDESWTILLNKLKTYRAEVDVTYRFVVANCKAYSLCMQAHGYSEPDCMSSRSEWTRSHEKFNQLALDLAMLEVPPPKPHHPPKPPCSGHSCAPAPACPTGCNVQGAVFSTGCKDACKGDGD